MGTQLAGAIRCSARQTSTSRAPASNLSTHQAQQIVHLGWGPLHCLVPLSLLHAVGCSRHCHAHHQPHTVDHGKGDLWVPSEADASKGMGNVEEEDGGAYGGCCAADSGQPLQGSAAGARETLLEVLWQSTGACAQANPLSCMIGSQCRPGQQRL